MSTKPMMFPSNEAAASRKFGVPIEDVTCWNCGYEGKESWNAGSSIAHGAITIEEDCVYCPLIHMDDTGDHGWEGDPHRCDICDSWVPSWFIPHTGEGSLWRGLED